MATPIMSFTVGTKDFRRALRAVSPHASRDDKLPMINRVRLYVDQNNLMVGATDRFTAAVGLVSVWESDLAAVGPVDLALADIGMILSVFTAGKESSNAGDSPEWQLRIELREKRTSTAVSQPDLLSSAVRVTDVSGMIPGEVLEFPALPPHSLFPNLPQLFANHLSIPAGLLDTFAVDGDMLARLKIAAKVYGDKALILSTPAADRSPVLARCGDSFLGLVMPRRMDEDERIAAKAWLEAWVRRLPVPSREIVVDLDEVRQPADKETADAALRAAAEAVISSQFGSASMLQRRLGISFKSATRILDELERRGVVGEADGSRAREVLTPPDKLAETLKSLTDDGEEAGSA
ncbi:DNA polymerase III sliding clamp [Gordonia phage Ewald]|nr:DNA polymerase III sliding clamp [Gordonia phage Ewald]